MTSDDTTDEVLSRLLGSPVRRQGVGVPQSSVVPALRGALLDMHIQSSTRPVNVPTRDGAFPGSLLAVIAPVVPDANRLRNDVRYACRNDQRTVLVNAANAGLLRLVCAQHVVDEVAEHSQKWTADERVPHAAFLHRWLVEYLPLIRVVRDDDIPNRLLTSDERARIAELRRQDVDDVPSASLALLLGAFYLSRDENAMKAVYGPNVDLQEHEQWVECLKAGSDAGQLGQMFQLACSVGAALGSAAARGTHQLWRRVGPIGFIPIATLLVYAFTNMRPETRSKVGAGAMSALSAFAEVHGEYQTVLRRFEQAAPDLPSWDEMSETVAPRDVLARACLHTLARAGSSNCSARELRSRLPDLAVPSGEAKVRAILRAEHCFSEVAPGRFQAGRVARPLGGLLDRTTTTGPE